MGNTEGTPPRQLPSGMHNSTDHPGPVTGVRHNADGTVAQVNATVRPHHIGKGSPTFKGVREYVRQEDYTPGDDAGHIISSHEGGHANQTWNVIPQNRGINRGSHSQMTKEVAGFVISGNDMHANVTANLEYEPGSRRPANITYETTGGPWSNHSDIQLHRRDFFPNPPTNALPEGIERVDIPEGTGLFKHHGYFTGLGKPFGR